MSSAPAFTMLSVCQFLTLPSQSASGLVFHSSLSLTPSSLLTVAHSGLTLVLDSLGGICCFLGFFLGLGSMLGGGCCAWFSSPDSPGSEDVAEMVDDPLDSGLGGELGEVRMAPLTGVTTAASLS